MRRSRTSPIIAQDREQLLGQHDIAVFATLALAHYDDHARAVDVLGGSHKAPARNHDDDDAQHDKGKSGHVGEHSAVRGDPPLRRRRRCVFQKQIESLYQKQKAMTAMAVRTQVKNIRSLAA